MSGKDEFTIRIPKTAAEVFLGLAGLIVAVGVVVGAIPLLASFFERVGDVWSSYDAVTAVHFRNVMLGIGAVVAGIAAIVGFGLSFWKNLIQQRLQRNDHRRLMADSFVKAVEQLGHEEYSIRIGGILALEKIAQSDPKNYHDAVYETLCAYVREKAAWKTATVRHDDERPKPPHDIQLILTVIGRRGRTRHEPSNLIDLTGTDLRGANLQGAYFQSADLMGAHLENANLGAAHFEAANLTEAHLAGADLRDARLINTYLGSSDLTGAELVGADCEWAVLTNSILVDAVLWGANLSNARGLPENTRDISHHDRSTRWP